MRVHIQYSKPIHVHVYTFGELIKLPGAHEKPIYILSFHGVSPVITNINYD